MKFLKNLFLFILLVVVIVGSFSISFVIGKRILVPTKKIPTRSFLAEKELAKGPLSEEISIEVETTAREMDKLASKYLAEEKIEEKIEVPAPKKPAVKKSVKGATSFGEYYVQVGAYSYHSNALNFKKELEGKGFPASVFKKGKYYRVYAGSFSTMSQAKAQVSKLKSAGYESFVRR